MSAEHETNPKSRIRGAPRSKIFWRAAILMGIIMGLLGTVVSLSPTGRWIERTIAHEWLFAARGVRPSPENVIVVSMDEDKSDLPSITRGDRRWSRHLYAQLIEQLTAADAHAIVLDVALEDKTDPNADRALERELSKSDRVVLFQRLTRTAVGDVPLLPLPRFASRVRARAVFTLPKNAERTYEYWPFFRALEPLSEYDEKSESDKIASITAVSKEAYTLVELPSLPVAALVLEVLQVTGAERFDQVLSDLGHGNGPGGAALFATEKSVMQAMIELRRTAMGGKLTGEQAMHVVRQHFGDDKTTSLLQSLFAAFAEPGTLHLNFYGPSRTIRTMEHGEVLEARQPGSDALTDTVAGSVVFVGYSDRSAVDQKDSFRTIYTSDDGVDLSGVEIAATAYANLVDDSALRPASAVTSLLIHVSLCVLVLLLALHTSIARAMVFTGALALAYFALSVQVIEASFYLLPLAVPILLILPITLFAALLYRHLRTLLQVDRYHYGMQLMMPSRAMRDIEADQVESAVPEHLHGACMITDVADYTHLSEMLSTESLTSMNREYFALLSSQTELGDGELIDFEGDSMTAVWTGAKTDSENGCSAALTAVNIMQALEQFNQTHADSPYITRIGIHAGQVTAGNIGGGRNFRHRVVGDIVNTSSRLEGLNKRLGTSVLATRAVVSDAEELLVRPVGTFILKGKTEALEVVEVIGYRATATIGQHDFVACFANVLVALADDNLESATQQLGDILSRDCNDGPTRFYLELLRGNGPPDVCLTDRGVVRVNGK